MITIWKPRMRADTGRREVGLAIHKVMAERETVQVQITYRRKDGSLLYPNTIFEIQRSKLTGWPEEVIKGVRLVIVPLDQFKEVPVR